MKKSSMQQAKLWTQNSVKVMSIAMTWLVPLMNAREALPQDILDTGKRVDGRGVKDLRTITADSGMVPRSMALLF